MILEKHYFILASQSPRRKILLKTILPKFEIIASDINENAVSYKTPVEYCQKVARLKALNVSDKLKKLNKTAIIISADTIVVLGNKIYGKPENATAAKDYIIELSGKIHQVNCFYNTRQRKRKINRRLRDFRSVHKKNG